MVHTQSTHTHTLSHHTHILNQPAEYSEQRRYQWRCRRWQLWPQSWSWTWSWIERPAWLGTGGQQTCRPLPPYSPLPLSGWTTWPARTAGWSAAHQATGEEEEKKVRLLLTNGYLHNNNSTIMVCLYKTILSPLPPSPSPSPSPSLSSPLPLPHPWIDVFDSVILPPEVENIVLLHILFIKCLWRVQPPVCMNEWMSIVNERLSSTYVCHTAGTKSQPYRPINTQHKQA